MLLVFIVQAAIRHQQFVDFPISSKSTGAYYVIALRVHFTCIILDVLCFDFIGFESISLILEACFNPEVRRRELRL